MRGLILYGPPASGKDTVTRELQNINSQYELFPRIKVGGGRTIGYRVKSADEADKAVRDRDVVWENRRYGARYLIDRSGLFDHLSQHVSVVHLGQAAAVKAVELAIPGAAWLIVSLWCPREIAISRIRERRTGDDAERAAAWDETEQLKSADIHIDTSQVAPFEAALQIEEMRQKLTHENSRSGS